MALKLKGSTSGFTAIDAPAVAGDNTLVLPGGHGTSGQYLQTDGAGALSWQTVSSDPGAEWNTGTAVSPTGVSSVTFDSIPSNAKVIYITFFGISWAVSSGYLTFRLGSGSEATTGYQTASVYLAQAAAVSVNGDIPDALRVNIWQANTTDACGTVKITNVTGNTWNMEGIFNDEGNNHMVISSGFCTLSGVLDRVIMRQSGGENFDDGTVQIHYITD